MFCPGVRRYHLNGYFSIEAALILPVTLVIFLQFMDIFLLQYNRYMMEQCAMEAAYRGATWDQKKTEDIYDVTMDAAKTLIRDKLLGTEDLSITVTVDAKTVKVTYETEKTTVQKEAPRFHPVKYVGIREGIKSYGKLE